jgi:hypothetical protein
MVEELSPSDMEVDVDGVFGRWAVVGWGNNATLLSGGGKVCAIINGGSMGSAGGGFLRAIRKGGGRGDTRGGGMGVEVGSVGDNGGGRSEKKEGERMRGRGVVYEEWERAGRWLPSAYGKNQEYSQCSDGQE